MSTRPVWSSAALLAVVRVQPRQDVDQRFSAPADADSEGRMDAEERRMLDVVRREADAELDALCAAMGDRAVVEEEELSELDDEDIEALPELPRELVLCLAPDDVLFDGVLLDGLAI
jgi:hypothetical protein